MVIMMTPWFSKSSIFKIFSVLFSSHEYKIVAFFQIPPVAMM